jgi:flavin reductase (DIM6/NTAB) family NADH-FMN oxidoreductase RutF
MPEVLDDTAAALLRHPYGLFLVGSAANGDANLMTATWGTQCSFKPRQYAVFIEADSHTHQLIEAGGAFSISLLPADVEDVVSRYTRTAEQIHEKVNPDDYFLTPSLSMPVWNGAVAWLECKLNAATPVGDHIQYTGEVLGGEVRSGDPAWTLQELGWEYGG